MAWDAQRGPTWSGGQCGRVCCVLSAVCCCRVAHAGWAAGGERGHPRGQWTRVSSFVARGARTISRRHSINRDYCRRRLSDSARRLKVHGQRGLVTLHKRTNGGAINTANINGLRPSSLTTQVHVARKWDLLQKPPHRHSELHDRASLLRFDAHLVHGTADRQCQAGSADAYSSSNFDSCCSSKNVMDGY